MKDVIHSILVMHGDVQFGSLLAVGCVLLVAAVCLLSEALTHNNEDN
jgi:hypothetical protein